MSDVSVTVEVVASEDAPVVGVMTGIEIAPPPSELVVLPRADDSEASEVKLEDTPVVTVEVTVPTVPEITLVPF